MSEATRAYLYRVGAAILPGLVVLGYVTADLAGHIMVILAAILAVGEGGLILASVNTSTSGGAASDA